MSRLRYFLEGVILMVKRNLGKLDSVPYNLKGGKELAKVAERSIQEKSKGRLSSIVFNANLCEGLEVSLKSRGSRSLYREEKLAKTAELICGWHVGSLIPKSCFKGLDAKDEKKDDLSFDEVFVLMHKDEKG